MVLYNQENDDTENVNQVTNKIKNTINSIKKTYSPTKIEKNLIKEIKKINKETDSENFIKKQKQSVSIEIPVIPESDNLRIGPQLKEQLTKLLREAKEITEKENISTEINPSQNFLWEYYSLVNTSEWESVAQKINILENLYEKEFHSVVESDYKKSRIYKQIFRRTELEKEKWFKGIKKKFKDFNNRKI